MSIELVERIKFRFANFLLNRRLYNSGSLSTPLDLDKARTIGIVYTIRNESEREAIKSFDADLKNAGKKVFLLEYVDAVEIPQNLLKTKNFIYFTHDDLSFFHLPKKSVVSDFTEQHFDIVMGFCFANCLPVHYLTAIAKADFKIGLYDKEYAFVYDFMLNLTPDTGIELIIEMLKYYMQSIHKN